MNLIQRISLFAAVALALPCALTAADGRIPISTVPFTISAPGHYYVTEDLSLSTADSTMISVAANGVTLDLDGHTLTQSGTGTTYVIAGFGIYHFEVGNGRIVGSTGASGVYLFAGAGSLRNFRVHDLVFDFIGFPIYFTVTSGRFDNVVIEHCQFWVSGANQIILQNVNNGSVLDSTLYNGSTSGTGVTGSGSNIEIARNRISGGNGIFLQGGPGFSIHDNTIRGIPGASTGINLSGVTASFIEANRISASSSTAIMLSGSANNNVLRNNDIAGAFNGLNISGSTGNIYSGTRITGTTTPYTVAVGNTNGGDNQ